MKNKALIDVSVLLIFFNRPEMFRQVFEEVRKARPSRLFLYQDGARNEADVPLVEECRRIALDIDWECEVHTLFQEENKGCDPSEYLADKWAFSLTDKCIILEDDDVPSQSFFPFCKEMLDRYEHDPRVWIVSGFNHEEFTDDVDGDYFFTEFPSIWGWATWRRVIETWDAEYKFLDNPKTLAQMKRIIRERGYRKDLIRYCRTHFETGREHYETILWASMILNSGLAIVPRVNMINNIGVSEVSTHFAASADTVPKGYRRIFTMKRHDLEFPLSHPVHLISHSAHRQRVYSILAWNRPWIKVKRSIEELFINLRKGNFRHISRSITKRVKKLARIN